MIDIRQTQEYGDYLKCEGWIVERRQNINYFIKKLPLIGSILKIQRPEEINFKTIEKLCRKYRVFQTIVEPKLATSTRAIEVNHNLLITHGFKLGKSPYLPSKTLQINLTQSISKITANFKKDARCAIRKTADADKRGGVTTTKICSTPLHIKEFHNAWRKSVKLTRFVPSYQSLINLRKSFSIHKPIILTSHNKSGGVIGGAIFTRSLHDYAYYWQGFTNNEGRTSLSQYSLVYQGILWAKKVGCRVFDFEGIYDARFPNKTWLGFTHFKKSFGGKEVSFPGSYIRFRCNLFT